MWVSVARLVRGQVLAARELEYVEATRALGYSHFRTIVRHIWPNIMGPVMVIAASNFASAIVIEAGLSFLGVGTGSNHPSWGSMIEAGQNYLKNAWWMIFFPGAALILTLYSANDLAQKIKIDFNPLLQK